MATTLADIFFAIRSEGDELTSDFVLDDELVVYVNQSYREMYNELITRGFYTHSTASYTVAIPNYSFAVPTDFYRFKGLDIIVSGQPWTVESFEWKNRNQSNWPWTLPFNPNIRVQYQVQYPNIVLAPQQQAAGSYVLHYYPKLTALAEPTDPITPFADDNGYWEYIVVDCCIKVKSKGDYPIDGYMMRKADILQKMNSAATKQDANSPVVGTGWNRSNGGYYGSGGNW